MFRNSFVEFVCYLHCPVTLKKGDSKPESPELWRNSGSMQQLLRRLGSTGISFRTQAIGLWSFHCQNRCQTQGLLLKCVLRGPEPERQCLHSVQPQQAQGTGDPWVGSCQAWEVQSNDWSNGQSIDHLIFGHGQILLNIPARMPWFRQRPTFLIKHGAILFFLKQASVSN